MSPEHPSLPASVLTVGSLHYDIMVEAEHLPRRDETAIGSRWYPKFGGKGGNQAVSAAKAGAVSHMFGAVGDDGFGRFLRENLISGGVADHLIATISGIGSGMSVAIQDNHGDYAATIVSAANLHIDPNGLESDRIWDGVGVLLLQNEIPEAVNVAAATQARSRGVLTVLNAAPFRDLSSGFASLIDILVVNAVEAEMMGADPVDNLTSAGLAAQKLAERFDCVIVTAGGQGLGACLSDRTVFCLPAKQVKVISSHGAGDAFIGALAASLARGADIEQSCKTASTKAAEHVAGLR